MEGLRFIPEELFLSLQLLHQQHSAKSNLKLFLIEVLEEPASLPLDFRTTKRISVNQCDFTNGNSVHLKNLRDLTCQLMNPLDRLRLRLLHKLELESIPTAMNLPSFITRSRRQMMLLADCCDQNISQLLQDLLAVSQQASIRMERGVKWLLASFFYFPVEEESLYFLELIEGEEGDLLEDQC